MKNIKLLGCISSFIIATHLSSAYGIQITNYYDHTMRVEAEDCSTYEHYKVFPSSQTWLSGNVVNKAKYLFSEELETGLYTILTGPSIPKKLCFNFVDRKNNQKPIMLNISTYDGCKLDVSRNEDSTGYTVYTNYDCFAKELQ